MPYLRNSLPALCPYSALPMTTCHGTITSGSVQHECRLPKRLSHSLCRSLPLTNDPIRLRLSTVPESTDAPTVLRPPSHEYRNFLCLGQGNPFQELCCLLPLLPADDHTI